MPNLIDTLTREFIKSTKSLVGDNKPKLVYTGHIAKEHMFGGNTVDNVDQNVFGVKANTSMSPTPMEVQLRNVACSPASGVGIELESGREIAPTLKHYSPVTNQSVLYAKPAPVSAQVIINPTQEISKPIEIHKLEPVKSSFPMTNVSSKASGGGFFAQVKSFFSTSSISQRVINDIMWIVGCILVILIILYLRCKFMEPYEDDTVSDFYPHKL